MSKLRYVKPDGYFVDTIKVNQYWDSTVDANPVRIIYKWVVLEYVCRGGGYHVQVVQEFGPRFYHRWFAERLCKKLTKKIDKSPD